MNFSSIKEYFYKLYNVGYLLSLFPLAVFIFLYLKLQESPINSIIEGPENLLIAQVVGFVFGITILTTVHLVTKKKMKSLSKDLSLGNKMDHYYYLSLGRIAAGAFVSAMMGIGLYITRSEVFSVYFLGILLWMAYHWPFPKKLCAELLLKGDEREMILHKKETL